MKKMNISEMSMENIPNSHFCSLDDSESKSINMEKTLSQVCSTDERESKSVIVNACSLEKSKWKSVHISVNTSEVKEAINKTKDEEPSGTDNPVINVPSYFKLYKCGKNFLNNLDAMYKRLWMANLQGKWDTEKLRYGWACMLDKKEKYYTELINTITTSTRTMICHYLTWIFDERYWKSWWKMKRNQ